MNLSLGSVCTGIGCIDLGLERAGLRLAWQCEIEARRRGVLARHWPDTPRYEDLRSLPDDPNLPLVDVLAGGTPCQDFSVAGAGEGLDGQRSGLFTSFIRLADAISPEWILWENVPNARSTPKGAKGEDFALLLEGFTGYRPGVPSKGWQSVGVCVGPIRWCVWRVLDGQWFGPPQRRKRLILVAGRSGAEPRPEVLLEPDCLPRSAPPSREARHPTSEDSPGSLAISGIPNVCGTVTRGVWQRGVHGSRAGHGFCIPVAGALTRSALTNGRDNNAAQAGHLVPVVLDLQQVTSRDNRSNPKAGDPSPTLTKRARPVVAFHAKQDPISNTDTVGAFTRRGEWGVAHPETLDVRRLTPTEVERCFGLPDGWTELTADGEPIKDTPRGEMLGDGAIVDLFEWIGRRLIAASAEGAAA